MSHTGMSHNSMAIQYHIQYVQKPFTRPVDVQNLFLDTNDEAGKVTIYPGVRSHFPSKDVDFC